MLQHGTRVTTPQAGDMTFYQNPDHVAIEVGKGYVISDGSTSGPHYLQRNYRPVYQTRRYPN
jgi:cell wall-associated NlpC family hydrolase